VTLKHASRRHTTRTQRLQLQLPSFSFTTRINVHERAQLLPPTRSWLLELRLLPPAVSFRHDPPACKLTMSRSRLLDRAVAALSTRLLLIPIYLCIQLQLCDRSRLKSGLKIMLGRGVD